LVPPAGGGTYCAVRLVLVMRPVLAKRDVQPMGDVLLVVRFTRHWIHYGFIGHTVVCVLIAAIEGLMGR